MIMAVTRPHATANGALAKEYSIEHIANKTTASAQMYNLRLVSLTVRRMSC